MLRRLERSYSPSFGLAQEVDHHGRDQRHAGTPYRARRWRAASRSQRGSSTTVPPGRSRRSCCLHAGHVEEGQHGTGRRPAGGLIHAAGHRGVHDACGGCACSPWDGRWCPRCRASRTGRPARPSSGAGAAARQRVAPQATRRGPSPARAAPSRNPARAGRSAL